MVGQVSYILVFVGPLGKNALLRAGKTDLLDAIDDGQHPAGEAGLLLHAHIGALHADDHAGHGQRGFQHQHDHRRHHQRRGKGGDLRNVDQREQARQAGGKHRFHRGGRQVVDGAELGSHLAGGMLLEEARWHGHDSRHCRRLQRRACPDVHHAHRQRPEHIHQMGGGDGEHQQEQDGQHQIQLSRGDQPGKHQLRHGRKRHRQHAGQRRCADELDVIPCRQRFEHIAVQIA